MALEPYNKVAGPRTTSTDFKFDGSKLSAWSGLVAEASIVFIPFCKMRTRSPSRPRMIGRLAAGPKYELLTPGIRANVCPKVGSIARFKFCPPKIDAACAC